MRVFANLVPDRITKLVILSSQKFCFSSLVFFSAFASPDLAQANPACFFLDSNGEPMDLGHLCGKKSNSANRSTLRTNPQDRNLIVIPIKRRVGGTPVVDVTFNNGHTFEMLFDTGATMTVISEEMAKKLQIKATGKLPFQTASSSLIYFETGIVESTTVGNLKKNNVNIAIAPTLDMGLLGQNLYGMYDITIKYGTIELQRR